ncbi:coiled-coil domain-containing protein 42 isoform X2 [Empidonax traillii]|uniref:coiled-coil domain-containing protein 42 isoform X2 n=1 Tax=Empidonax traillii TaxID=164674 RepID=UPI000FFD05F7|nr:coiled-coil domain-containing protein 42 isoform X2 [Empidonax traillii]
MAGAMDPGDNENANYYREQYRANLLTLLRELGEPDEDPASSFMCLLKKKKELRCLEEDVEEKKEAFRERLEAIAEQWRDLHARRTQLKARVERSGRTVQENEMLRNQALRKASKDREENIKKENELLRAKRELEALRKQHQKLCQKLPKYSVFKRYLEDVVEVSQEAQWMDIQNRAAKKSTKLRAIERTIHGLFHAASTRLNAKWKVAAHDTHRQLEMIQQFIEDLRDISMEDMEKYK